MDKLPKVRLTDTLYRQLTYGLPLLGDPLVERRVGLQQRPQLQQRHLVLQVRLVEWLRPENQMQD